MTKLIDIFLTRAFLVVCTWIKRHPWLTVFLLILLFLIFTLPNFLQVLAFRTGITALINMVNRGLTWLGAARWRWWALNFLLFLMFPLLGALVFAWLVFDYFKQPARIKPVEAEEPKPEQDFDFLMP